MLVGGGRAAVVAVALALAAAAMVAKVESTRWTVGSNMGWTTNVNYSIWAEDKHFLNGDWLYFVYDRYHMDVLEVNKTDYETCNSDHPLQNWTTGAGRDVVPLNETRHYYLISGRGFCYGGMKIDVSVENPPPPPAAATGKSAASVSVHRGGFIVPILLCFCFICCFQNLL